MKSLCRFSIHHVVSFNLPMASPVDLTFIYVIFIDSGFTLVCA